ncbi:methyltransferase domain-containing protein [Longispora sp. NPDC051575]|uniref:methyltransferase domain-containing protein n=1 Tax=Longispora sp. NPDC051575 TaxID=3154943 RepID=UPI003425B582
MTSSYALGHADPELARLEHQAAMLAPATSLILRNAGIGPGMRVLDLGTGTGDVARLAADLVGPTGSVVGVDRSADALRMAASLSAGHPHVSFVEDDIATWRDPDGFDAIVGRLVLVHTPAPADVLRHHAATLRPGGVVVAAEFDMTGARSVPATPLVTRAREWICGAIERAGMDPGIGARLGSVFAAAGLGAPTMVGVQGYHPAGDPNGPLVLSGVLRSLLPLLEATGMATAAEVDVETVRERVAAELAGAGAVFVPPTLVGAWARR